MTTIKLITEEKERKRLSHNSIIQKFDESGKSITPVLRPVTSRARLEPNNLTINRTYKDSPALRVLGLYNTDLRGKIKQTTYIYADCKAFFDYKKFDMESLDDSILDEMSIDFVIFSADIDESIFYSGCVNDQILRTDIFLNHHEFQKLEDAIEKQNLENCYLLTDIKGIYSEKNIQEYMGTDTKKLFYLSETMSSKVQDIDLINKDSLYALEVDFARGNNLFSSKMVYQSQLHFDYQIQKKF